MEYEDAEYSIACNIKKYSPSNTLKETHTVETPANNSWWASVAVKPLINKITVFNNGTWKGGIMCSPSLGQFNLPPERGATLTWKNLQNTLKKNQTSLNKNQNNPHFREPCTSHVWWPWKVLSRPMSRNQITNNNKVIDKAILKKNMFQPNLNQNKTLVIPKNLLTLMAKGSHLLSTKWDSCHVYPNPLSWKESMLLH